MVYQIHFNYILFCLLVGFLFYFQKKYVQGATKGVWFLLFFMASPIMVDNHNWAIQSFFHYCEIFGVLAIFFATKEKIQTSDYWWAVLFAVFSTYAFAAGMFFAITVFGVLIFREIKNKSPSISTLAFRVLPILILVFAMGAWFIGYHKPAGHPPFTWPYKWDFWYFYSNLISLGFGYKTSNAIIALLSLAIVTLILWNSWKEALTFKKTFVSFAFFGAIAVLGALASIALSRVGFGIGQAKTSRYSELGILLVPFIGWLWWRLAQDSPRFKKYHRHFVWFIAIGFVRDFSYHTYFVVQQDRTQALDCIAKYYRGENKDGFCPVLYPHPIGDRLDRAKELNMSWLPENNNLKLQPSIDRPRN